MLERNETFASRFVLLRRLGAGARSQVWLALDRDEQREIALKLTQPASAAIEREYELLQRWRHPHIVRAFGVHRGMYRGEPHVALAMEHAAAGDVAKFRVSPHQEVLKVVVPVARALGFLHRAGWVHRDVKSSNVLLMSDGAPKLSDLGIAAAIGSLHAAPGSRYSMSPQQRAGGAAAVADDIFGLGALLYELICGYPPFYPHTDPQQSHTIRPLPDAAPMRLRELVLRMLACEPAERPDDMDTVERELKSASGEPRDAQHHVHIEPPSLHAVHGEPLRAEWRKSTQAAVDPLAIRRQGFRRGLSAAAIAMGVLAVAIVFLVLPKWVGQGDESAASRAAQPASVVQAASQAPAEDKKEVDFAALARAKQHAEEMRAALDDRFNKLRDHAAEKWGKDTLQQATAAWALADQKMQSREYTDAEAHFGEVQKAIETLEARLPVALEEQLNLGDSALAEGRSADATAAYGLAKQIDANNARAAHGLKRAATLDQVLALVANADLLEKNGDMNGAVAGYRQALALDNETARASEGVARIEAQLANDAFASAMARGYSALAVKNYAGARSAFEAARKIRPSAAEIDQGIRQIEQEQRTQTIEAKLAAARDAESQERWGEALQTYREAHDLDATVAAANEGIARTEPRAALNDQLELYLTQPGRMFSQPVRFAAKESLARASQIENPGPVLQQQVAKLREWLARADAPVAVALESDNLTQVTIYRVGTLGMFTQRQLKLSPGQYTVVGTRPGYRDVRREIAVTPMAALDPIVIRCEDRI
jgi:hypothetical protein